MGVVLCRRLVFNCRDRGGVDREIKCWKNAMTLKGLRVNMDRTKVMCCTVRIGQGQNSGSWSRAICKARVGANSINRIVSKKAYTRN